MRHFLISDRLLGYVIAACMVLGYIAGALSVYVWFMRMVSP